MTTKQLRMAYFVPVAIVLVGLLAVAPLALQGELMARSADHLLAAAGHCAAVLGAHAWWVAAYGFAAATVAGLLAALAIAHRPADTPAPAHVIGLALVAGLLWPVLGLGVAQFGVLAVAGHLVGKVG